MRSIYFLLLFFALFFVPKQGTTAIKTTYITENESWSNRELSLANTAKNTDYLSFEEQQIIFYMNLIRMDGLKFFNTYFKAFVKDHNQRMRQYRNYNELKINVYDRYYRGLEVDLKQVKDLGLFYPDETLTYVALQHGKEMNKRNRAGHNSYDGRSPQNRIEKYYPNKAMAENLAFGFSKGLANVCMLLLDKGVPDLGHRKNILNTTGLNIVGVSIQPHPAYKYAATIDFVGIPNLKN